MAFCTSSDFVGNLNIDTSSPEILAALNECIAEVENNILINYTLGYRLYTDFLAGMAIVTPAQKWIDLRDGKVFEVEIQGVPIEIKYEGIANMLKYFVYFEFRKYTNENFTNLTNVLQQTQNAATQTPVYKLANVYNEGAWLNGKIQTDYEVYSIVPSVFNFIYTTNNKSMTYGNWIFQEIKPINGFSL